MTVFTPPTSDFAPADLDVGQWENIEPLYAALLAREINSREALEQLLLDRSELDASVREAFTNRHIAMTCHTDDEAIRQTYLDFVEIVSPKVEEMGFQLDGKIVDSPHATELDAVRHEVLLRDLRADVEIFREENIALGVKDKKLGQRHAAICGEMMITFRGEERTMQQMGVFLEETDRGLREEAWRLMSVRRYADHENFDDLYDEMIKLRHQAAVNAGYKNCMDYTFDRKHRFDYTPADCRVFHDAVERVCVPLMRRLNEERREVLGVDTLRPWDLGVDPQGRGPMRPFNGADDLVARASRLFHRLQPGLGELFDLLRDGDSLDLESRKGKRPGGYQAYRARARRPFIFMNATGQQMDVRTMIHEAGHAFHALLCRDEPLLHYRSYPSEIAEVAAMGMELISHPYLDDYYPGKDADRARHDHLERIVVLLPWVATIDAFQHWIYTNPDHTRDERTAHWLELMDRFGSAADWSGLEEHRMIRWQQQGHLFSYPFYYIEYGIAMLGALQIWRRSRTDADGALADYIAALSLGGSRPLPALFAAAGIEFDFGPQMLAGLMAEVETALGESSEAAGI